MQSSGSGSDPAPDWFSWHGNELRLRVHILPRSSRAEIGQVHNHRVKVHLTAPPVDGKANEQLIKFLAKTFGVSKSSVQITAGLSSRFKTVAISQPGVLPTLPGLGPETAKNR